MASDIRDGLVENLLLLNFSPSFPVAKEFIFNRRNIKVVAEEVLHFLLGRLGYSDRFVSSCWPVASPAQMHEFKMAVFRILEDLKKTNDNFKCCSVQVRKSLMDEYSGGTSAGGKIELLFFELSCIAVELEHTAALDSLADERVVFDLHKELYDLTISSEQLDSEWSGALQRQRIKLELLQKEREELIENIEHLCPTIDFERLDFLVDDKTREIEHVLQLLMHVNENVGSFLRTETHFRHLERAISGEFRCDLNPLATLVRDKFNKEFFCLSLQHENFALDFSKLIQTIYRQIKVETMPKLSDTQCDALATEIVSLHETEQKVTNRIEKLSTLKEKLETEFTDLIHTWNHLAAQFLQTMPQRTKYSFVLPEISLESIPPNSIFSTNTAVAFRFQDDGGVSCDMQEMPSIEATVRQIQSAADSGFGVDEEDIDSKYIAIPRNSPVQPRLISPNQQRDSSSLLKCALKNKIGFRERLEVIKRKYNSDESGPPAKRIQHTPKSSPTAKQLVPHLAPKSPTAVKVNLQAGGSDWIKDEMPIFSSP